MTLFCNINVEFLLFPVVKFGFLALVELGFVTVISFGLVTVIINFKFSYCLFCRNDKF